MSTTPARAVAHVRSIAVETLPAAAVAAFAQGRLPAILESTCPTGRFGRFSIFACDPVDTFCFDARTEGCPFCAFADHAARFPVLDRGDTRVPFAGGWIGYFSYEAGLRIEGIPPGPGKTPDVPLVRFALYDAAAVYDHVESRWYAAAVEWSGPLAARRPPVADRLAAVERRLRDAAPPPVPPAPVSSPPVPNMTVEQYADRVRRAKEYISAGDIYQVNLTQRWSVETSASTSDLYLRLRDLAAFTHGGLLTWDNAAVVSASPELFLDLRDGHVITRPIKGTRPRTGEAAADAAVRRELLAAEKESAELNMIVDLLRNDLGRVCRYGTVRVTEPAVVEEYANVLHRVATVEGRLAAANEPPRSFGVPGCHAGDTNDHGAPVIDRTAIGTASRSDWLDLVLAAFPGGSITGCPKIRAMQISEELEPTPRGVYCGSMGCIGLDGSMSLNIAIRTMVQRGRTVHVHAGGAIVADSTPEGEYEECRLKAQGMLRALAAR